MSKKIIFRPTISEEFLNNDKPFPAVKAIPEWLKKFKRYADESKKLRLLSSQTTNLSVKACPPFMDAFYSGYLICLQNDIFVEDNDAGLKEVRWTNGGTNFVSLHSSKQIPQEMIPEECDPQAFKFLNIWSIKLPKGYSALITHPMNRNDLPFITLSGVVDFDSYNNPVNLPFFLKKHASGIIPAGTPIAQVIPFKRESWSSSVKKFDQALVTAQRVRLKQKIYQAYKSLDWKKKSFK